MYNLENVRHGQKRTLKVRSNSPLFLIFQLNLISGLYHSWGVQEEDFPDCLEVTALCDEGVVMAMQHKSLPIYSVQFHPESYMSDFGENFA